MGFIGYHPYLGIMEWCYGDAVQCDRHRCCGHSFSDDVKCTLGTMRFLGECFSARGSVTTLQHLYHLLDLPSPRFGVVAFPLGNNKDTNEHYLIWILPINIINISFICTQETGFTRHSCPTCKERWFELRIRASLRERP